MLGAHRWRLKAAAIAQDVLGAPLDIPPGQTLATLVTAERIGTWIDSARHPLHQEGRASVTNGLVHPIEPGDPSKGVEPMQWLLELAAEGGAELTRSKYLARVRSS